MTNPRQLTDTQLILEGRGAASELKTSHPVNGSAVRTSPGRRSLAPELWEAERPRNLAWMAKRRMPAPGPPDAPELATGSNAPQDSGRMLERALGLQIKYRVYGSVLKELGTSPHSHITGKRSNNRAESDDRRRGTD